MRKLERDFLQGHVVTGQRRNGFKLKEGRFRLNIRKKFFTVRMVRHWYRVPQRSCGCPILGSVQRQVGWGSEQPGLLEGIPAHGRGVEMT